MFRASSTLPCMRGMHNATAPSTAGLNACMAGLWLGRHDLAGMHARACTSRLLFVLPDLRPGMQHAAAQEQASYCGYQHVQHVEPPLSAILVVD